MKLEQGLVRLYMKLKDLLIFIIFIFVIIFYGLPLMFAFIFLVYILNFYSKVYRLKDKVLRNVRIDWIADDRLYFLIFILTIYN